MAAKKGKTEVIEAVTATDGTTQRGLCTVPLEGLLQLLREDELADAKRFKGRPHQILNVNLTATTQPNCVACTATFTIRVFDVAMQHVSLLPATAAATSVLCFHNPNLMSTDVNREEAQAGGSVYFASDKHVFRPDEVGLHVVEVAVLIPYSSKNKAGWSLSYLPHCPLTDLTFTVANRDNVQVSIEPSYDVVSQAANEGSTVVRAFLPPTNNLSVRWTEQETEAQAAAAQPVTVTVDNHHLFSVGEGMLLVETDVLYEIRNGSVSSFEILADDTLRVLSVDGNHIRRWDVSPYDGSATADLDIAAAPTPKQLIKIILDTPVEGSFELQLRGELALPSTSCAFTAPLLCHVQSFVTREKGVIGCEARTNVELEQPANPIGCVSIDVEELPPTLKSRASNPLLLAYKYLLPRYQLKLQVQKHGDVDVLMAVIDSAHCIATQTEEGSTMYQLIMKIRNTQKQYVRIALSRNCHISSTVLNGQPVKPARDTETESLMVPLQKAGSGHNNSFIVELVWIGDQETKMLDNGDVTFKFPAVDLPMNIFFASVYMPNNFRYGEFAGDVREVPNFSQTPPRASSGEVAVPGAAAPVRARAADRRMQRAISIESMEDQDAFGGMPQVQMSNFAQSNVMFESSKAAPMRKQKKVGIVPVHVEMVTAGQVFRFERLLITEQALEVSVPFRRKQDRKHRTLRSCFCF